MLAKSHAKIFFLAGTGLFSAIFLLLTVDTLRQVPARSHEDTLTAEVVSGKTIWDSNNCMGCHTLLGEGAYYAPELTKVVDRRGKEWMKLFLKDPNGMFPGERKMVQYKFTDAQINDLIAFFDWVGKVDANGFPPKPDIASPAVATTTTPSSAWLTKAPAIFTSVCVACHSVEGRGGKVGPALDGVHERFSKENLELWLSNPSAVKPGTTMPNLNLSAADKASLIAWLMTPAKASPANTATTSPTTTVNP